MELEPVPGAGSTVPNYKLFPRNLPRQWIGFSLSRWTGDWKVLHTVAKGALKVCWSISSSRRLEPPSRRCRPAVPGGTFRLILRRRRRREQTHLHTFSAPNANPITAISSQGAIISSLGTIATHVIRTAVRGLQRVIRSVATAVLQSYFYWMVTLQRSKAVRQEDPALQRAVYGQGIFALPGGKLNVPK